MKYANTTKQAPSATPAPGSAKGFRGAPGEYPAFIQFGAVLDVRSTFNH